MAAALDLLHAEVEAFGRTVAGAGVVVGEDLSSPRGEGLAEGSDLGDVVVGAAGNGLFDQQLGVGSIVGEVEVADVLLCEPRPE